MVEEPITNSLRLDILQTAYQFRKSPKEVWENFFAIPPSFKEKVAKPINELRNAITEMTDGIRPKNTLKDILVELENIINEL